jgi:hypothetical protein
MLFNPHHQIRFIVYHRLKPSSLNIRKTMPDSVMTMHYVSAVYVAKCLSLLAVLKNILSDTLHQRRKGGRKREDVGKGSEVKEREGKGKHIREEKGKSDESGEEKDSRDWTLNIPESRRSWEASWFLACLKTFNYRP